MLTSVFRSPRYRCSTFLIEYLGSPNGRPPLTILRERLKPGANSKPLILKHDRHYSVHGFENQDTILGKFYLTHY